MDEYESEVRLLRKRFKAAPTDGLAAKKIRFKELADCLITQCPNKKYSPKSVSTAVKLAFPRSFSMKTGKSRHSYYFGIEESLASGSASSVVPQTAASAAIQQQPPQASSSQQQSPSSQQQQFFIQSAAVSIESAAVFIQFCIQSAAGRQ